MVKVTLILPAYNEEETIDSAIMSAINQDYEDAIEVIVIDDGSTDETQVRANRHSGRWRGSGPGFPERTVRVLQHSENRGKPAGLNTGFRNATGEICIFADTDSYLATDFVSKIIEPFSDPAVGMVAGMVLIDNESNLLTRLQQMEYIEGQYLLRHAQHFGGDVLICPGGGSAIRTDLAQEIQSKDRTIAEDADLTMEAINRGWKVKHGIKAVSHTKAPETVGGYVNQRKRWIFGGFQALSLNPLKNSWWWWAWIISGYAPLSLAMFSVSLFLTAVFDAQYSIFFIAYLGISFLAFALSRTLLLTLAGKKHLTPYLPIYYLYSILLQLMRIWMLLAYLTEAGVTVTYGGAEIHAEPYLNIAPKAVAKTAHFLAWISFLATPIFIYFFFLA